MAYLYLTCRISLKRCLTSALCGLIQKNQEILYLPLIKEDVKVLPGHVLPSVTSGSTLEHRLLLSDLIRIKVTKICKFCRTSPKRSMTAAGTELDGAYLIPSSTPKSRISKHDPADFSVSTRKPGRIYAPCPQLIKSAYIFKTMLLQMDFYRQASAGTSFPQIRKEM